MASKRYATVDKRICVACGACENICPLGALMVHKGCFAKVAEDKCVGCGKCEKVCPSGAIKVDDSVAVIDYSLCTDCGKCVEACPRKIIHSSGEKAEVQ